ncbi:hypothetical protein [Arenimonas daejeonensis]|uniref:hypothetical protein n=1 Tax=Arenimonas daejeonensis TaxID=370777 RepID=UPI0011BF869F|nr:hypothetical protein [Arenimonas daejeonensis]
MTSRLPAWALFALLSFVIVLGACRREQAEPARASGDPVAAVEGLAGALRDNDLVRYSRLSLPPDLHARSEALWLQRQAEAEPPTPEDAAEYEDMMARLMAPDAETALMRDLEPKLAKLETEIAGQWPLMQATASIFLNAMIQANTELSDAEKAHGSEVVASLMAWAQPSLFTDRERARQAVAALSRTARELDLPTLDQARALPMQPALEKGGIALAGAKDVARAYGLDLDRSLDGVRAELVSAEGDQAVVKVSYPLLDKTVSFEMAMQRRDDAWYSAEAVAQAEAELAEAAGSAPADEDAPDTGAVAPASADTAE